MNNRRITLVAYLIGIASIVGCGKNDEKAKVDSQKPSPSSTVGGYPKLTRQWLDSNGRETSNSASPILGGDSSLKFIGESFQKLEWAKPELKPRLAIEMSDAESLEIRLSSGSTADQPVYVALWTRPGSMLGGATTSIVKQSPRISGADQAIDLLRSYVTENGDAATLVEWKD